MAKIRPPVGPYSRTLRRGAIGTTTIDGRSTTGRYLRDLERQLIEHLGGRPTIAQRLLVDRLVKTSMQLVALDEKMRGENWTDIDSRTHNGLVNRQRLLLRELGLKGAEARDPSASFRETLHEIAAGREKAPA